MPVHQSVRHGALAVLFALGSATCAPSPPPAGSSRALAEEAAGPAAAGGLLHMEMRSTVGVLLDEIQEGPLRDAAAAHALAEHDPFWIARAMDQTRLTYYRLVFRSSFYDESLGKGPLPLPPKDVWGIRLTGRPHREHRGGHDLVTVDYTFESYLVTDAASPGTVEPRLAKINGSWDEPFDLPLDPELLLERTGYSCMDEAEYPVPSVFEENTWYFYDQTCDVETPDTSSCHRTLFPALSCTDALTQGTGIIHPKMSFRRVRYDRDLAQRYRVGQIHNPAGADLAVVQEGVQDENRIFYRYFDAGSCEIAEGAIGATGWRRVLTFSAVVRNDGTEPVHVGDPTDPSNPWVKAHAFEYSACHNHFHFSHYGTFDYGGMLGSKRAFCLEETNRFHNDESTPLTADHQSCSYQGINPGWGDEYELGLPGQWVDVTDVSTTTPKALTFQSNPDQFLCEGTPLSLQNTPVDPLDLADIAFDPTSFKDPDGNTVSRMRCAFPSGWDDNNLGSAPVSSPGGSFVTESCKNGQLGPLRDCGFSGQQHLRACRPGTSVHARCWADGPPQVLRVCEKSEKLGVGVACGYGASAVNIVVDEHGQDVRFTCPAVRDAAVAGTGGYSVYQAPVLPWQPAASIHCTGW